MHPPHPPASNLMPIYLNSLSFYTACCSLTSDSMTLPTLARRNLSPPPLHRLMIPSLRLS
ncbi:hypothetical protein M405DRAFT_937847 [Rhizopogon salebrosus TDB-379]|nr:hypothetical protein M405DRAFT_937847 [Rhizopogon salebrosus TDB-379]